MFQKILVPLDGSELAERALNLAKKISKANAGTLILLRVVSQMPIVAADPNLHEEINRLGKDESNAYLRSIVEKLDPEINMQVVVESGPAADTIVNYAVDNEVDLIVMSSNGRSGIDRWIYGSVAERVLRSGCSSTAVINPRGQFQLPENIKIMVPLDGSKLAEKALDPAITLAKKIKAEVNLLRVEASSHQILETTSMQQVFDSIEEKELHEADAYLKSQRDSLAEIVVNTDVKVTEGSVPNAIIEYAEEKKINLIIMTSHGRTGLQRWVYGSVAEKILRGACCATMIIRTSFSND